MLTIFCGGTSIAPVTFSVVATGRLAAWPVSIPAVVRCASVSVTVVLFSAFGLVSVLVSAWSGLPPPQENSDNTINRTAVWLIYILIVGFMLLVLKGINLNNGLVKTVDRIGVLAAQGSSLIDQQYVFQVIDLPAGKLQVGGFQN